MQYLERPKPAILNIKSEKVPRGRMKKRKYRKCIMVAAADYEGKADYRCLGRNDNETIQEAIDNLFRRTGYYIPHAGMI